MFQKVLVANRGEIAVRIIQTLREKNIASVAVYSTADRHALHVRLADESVCIGPAKATDSYLNMRNIVSAAVLTGADAVHPGFGFLAENAEFAELCAQAHLVFIGPTAQTIRELGDKAAARATAQALGVPIIPGTGELADVTTAVQWAKKTGFPLLLKAAGGGGGKGIRIVHDVHELSDQYRLAQAEARATAGNAALYLEKVISPAKHIEVQIVGDERGHHWIFPERDCSLQRNKQKLLEMSPSLTMAPDERRQLQQLARKIAVGTKYLNAGTIEFLQDAQGQFYFMEMNTRIQVEHPVTELVTGVDLLAMQIEVAAGGDLQENRNIAPVGVAIECRINAEDPLQNFAPAAGTVPAIAWPLGGSGVRIDRGITAGDVISPFYDSMVAKLIASGSDAQTAWRRISRMLGELHVSGVPTTRALHADLVQDETVQSGHADTEYLVRDWLPRWRQRIGEMDGH